IVGPTAPTRSSRTNQSSCVNRAQRLGILAVAGWASAALLVQAVMPTTRVAFVRWASPGALMRVLVRLPPNGSRLSCAADPRRRNGNRDYSESELAQKRNSTLSRAPYAPCERSQ